MSSDGADRRTDGVPDDFARLQDAVRRLLDELAGYRARAERAERKNAELETTLRDLSSGALDPMQLREGARKLKTENEELRRRIVEARDRIRRLVARFDFLREEM